MLKQNHRAWVEVDLSAIRHNVCQLKSLLTAPTELMAIVKADAYGHGAIDVSQAAIEAGASWLGVATIPEGIQLRNAGITAPIAILGATNGVDEIKAIAEYRLQPTICNAKQALIYHEVLSNIGAQIPVHLKIDTGMSRLGVNWQEAIAFIKLVQHLPNLEILSVYSHFATADDRDLTFMQLQTQRFQQVIAELQSEGIYPPYIHICNTAAMLCDRQIHYDIVRTGLGIYGLYPAPHLQNLVDLRPALTVKARITQVKEITAGTSVSYGRSFIAKADMKMATVAIGYADGIPRGLSNRLHVSVKGQKVAQIGTITMDQCAIDVTHIPDVNVGDVVTFLGGASGNTADDWAELLGTISWEILCGFKHRLPRINVVNAISDRQEILLEI
ncbi:MULTISPECIES: alanine racemase [Pseudanabaena]|uniref:Alanine racemase n=2 Tax=Pseudanabaena TaxID=1152 RepID=L8MTR4_9CYAN|nr:MULTISPECIES: alanine racemase [Pseudanabaena]ELS30821.1 Alanine racemase [Pseudanabaena biceps PCC 7429]MDG3496904.1 alanine racemase [Pseudanabaena catenata USMAC16]